MSVDLRHLGSRQKTILSQDDLDSFPRTSASDAEKFLEQ
jgi:hypothetical protein